MSHPTAPVQRLLRKRRRQVAALLATLGLTAAAPFAPAATFYWTGNGNWNTTNTNWGSLSGGPYGSVWGTITDDAIFEGGAGTVTLTATNPSAHNLTFNTTGYAITGGTLTLGGTTPTITAGSGISTTISSVLAGSAGLTKAGLGTLTLNGSAVNTLTGGVTVTGGGTLQLDYTNLVTPTNLLNSGNALTLKGGNLTVNGNSSATTSQTFASTAINTGATTISVISNGGQTANLTLGTITAGTSGAPGGFANFVLPTAGSIFVSNSNTSGILGQWATIGTGTSMRYATVSGGAIASYAGGTSTTTLSGNNPTVNYDLTTSSGTGAIADGSYTNTVRYTGTAATLTLSGAANNFGFNGFIAAGSASTLTISANYVTTGVFNSGNGFQDMVIAGPQNITFTGNFYGTGGTTGLTYAGTGILTLSGGVNTAAGTLTVASGKVVRKVTSSGDDQSAFTTYIIASGATFELAATSGARRWETGTVNILGGGTFLRSGAGTIYFANGGNAVTFNQSAGGLADFEGGTSSYLRTASTNLGGLTINSATVTTTHLGGSIFFDALNGNSSGIYSTEGGTTTLTLGVNNGGGTFAGVIQNGSGTVSLTKQGTGTQVLSGANTYTGATSVTGGILTVSGASGSIASSTVVNVSTGATLNLSTTADNKITNSGTWNISGTLANTVATNAHTMGTVNLTNGTLTTTVANTYGFGAFFVGGSKTITGNGSSNLISGSNVLAMQNGVVLTLATPLVTDAISVTGTINNGTGSSTGAISKTGLGTVTLSGANGYSGTTSVTGGTLKAGNTAALGNTSSLTVTSPGTFDLGGNNITIASLVSSTGTITDSSAAGSGGLFKITGSVGTGNANLFTGSVAVQLGNGGASVLLTNTANTFSGGVYLGVGSTNLARYATGTATVGNGVGVALTSGIFGTGTINIGKAATDEGQIWVTGAATINNPITYNSILGTDVVGAVRIDTSGATFAGVQTAGLSAISYGAYSGGSLTVTGQLTGSGTFTGTITNATGNLGGGTVIGTNAGLIIGSSNVNAATIILNNTGTANNYSGDTYITASGVLQTSAADQIPNGAGKGNVVDNGTLKLGGFSDTINGLSGSGTVDGVSGTPTLTVGDNDTTSTFSGILKNTAGNIALTKTGAGTLILTGASTFTGVTTINGGVLQIGNAGTTGNLGTGTVTVTSPGNLSFNRTNALTVANAISGDGSVTQAGSGTTSLTATNTYTGNTTVSAGTLVVGNGTSVGAIASGSAVSIASGATMSWNNSNSSGATVTLANNISGAGTLLLQGSNSSVNTIFSSYALSGANGSLTGTLAVNRARINAVTAQSQIGSAALDIQLGGTLVFSAAGTITNNITIEQNAGWADTGFYIGTLRLEGTNTLSGNITLNDTTMIVSGDGSGLHSTLGGYSTAGTSTLSGVISGAGNFAMSRFTSWNGGSVVAVNIDITGTGSNTYTGTTVVDGQGAVASLRLGKTGGAIAIQGGTTVQMGSNTGGQANLRMLASNQFGTSSGGVLMNFINSSGNWMRFDLRGTTQTLAGLNAGSASTQAGAVVQNVGIDGVGTGTGTLTLSGSGTYLYNGYLRDQDNGATTNKLALAWSGSGTQTLVGSVVNFTGGASVSAGTLKLIDTTAWASTVAMTGGTLELNTATAWTFPSAITGTVGTLRKTGAGTVSLNNADSLLNVFIDGGTLKIFGAQTFNRFGNNAAITINNGGTLELAEVNTTPAAANSIDLTINAGGTFKTDGGSGFHAHIRNITLAGGSITGLGTGNYDTEDFQLNGDVTVSGSAASTITLNNGIGLSGTRTFNVADVTSSSAADLTISGTGDLQNSGSVGGVTKTGAGTLVLTNNNTYTGATLISAGVVKLTGTGAINGTSSLTINGSGAEANFNSSVAYSGGAINVTSGTLSGTTTVNAAVTVGASGTLSPGNSPGVQTYGAGLNLSAGGTYEWQLGANSASNSPTVNFDQIILAGGNLVLGGTSKISINFTDAIAGGGPTSNNSFWNTAHSWTVIDVTTGTNTSGLGFNTLLNATAPEGNFTQTVVGGDVILTYNPNSVFNPAPSPLTINVLRTRSGDGTTVLTNNGVATGGYTTTPTGVSITSGATGAGILAGGTANLVINTGTQNTAGANLALGSVSINSNGLTTSVNLAANVFDPISITSNGAAITNATGVFRANAAIISSASSNSNFILTDLAPGTVISPGETTGSANLDISNKLNGMHRTVVSATVGYDANQNIQGLTGGDNVAVSDTVNQQLLINTVGAGNLHTAQTAKVLAGQSYGYFNNITNMADGFGSTVIAGVADPLNDNNPTLGTTATILGGSNTTAGVQNLSMTWRARTTAELAMNLLDSDIVDLTGIDGHLFVLQMSYDPTAVAANGQGENSLYLGYLNEQGSWVNAILGNHGVNTGIHYTGAWNSVTGANSTLVLGSYGIDVSNHVVWAVLDHNSEFAVIPEPLALPAGLFMLTIVGVISRRRRRNA